MIDEERPEEEAEGTPPDGAGPEDSLEELAAQEQPAEEPVQADTPGEPPAAEPPVAPDEPSPVEEAPAVVDTPTVNEPLGGEEPVAAESTDVEELPAEAPPAADAPPAAAPPAADRPPAAAPPAADAPPAETPPPAAEAPAERVKPAIPGADLEVDIVPEGTDPLGREQAESGFEEDVLLDEEPAAEEQPPPPVETELPRAAIDLASGARYIATGKRKTAVARVILRPGAGEYTINGKGLNDHFPRPTAQRNIRQPLETVGYDSRMDVVATLHGGGISAQAGALRHGIARALIEADPNLRVELKRRGFLTRDSRAKERRKAGLKKARKRPQFSKR